MTVNQLRELLAPMPGHWPVSVEVICNGLGYVDGKGSTTDYHYTLDCITSNFPTQGGHAVVRLNYEPT